MRASISSYSSYSSSLRTSFKNFIIKAIFFLVLIDYTRFVAKLSFSYFLSAAPLMVFHFFFSSLFFSYFRCTCTLLFILPSLFLLPSFSPERYGPNITSFPFLALPPTLGPIYKILNIVICILSFLFESFLFFDTALGLVILDVCNKTDIKAEDSWNGMMEGWMMYVMG